jgi:hypothetical protein
MLRLSKYDEIKPNDSSVGCRATVLCRQWSGCLIEKCASEAMLARRHSGESKGIQSRHADMELCIVQKSDKKYTNSRYDCRYERWRRLRERCAGLRGVKVEVKRGPGERSRRQKSWVGRKRLQKKAPTSEPFFSWFLEIPWMRKN